VRKRGSAWLWGSIISWISFNIPGYFSSVFGFCRADRSFTHETPVRNSFIPNSTVSLFQPNTSSATRCLLPRRETVTSPIARRRSGQGIKSTKREISSTISVDTPFRTKVEVFIFVTPYFEVYEDIIYGILVFTKSLRIYFENGV
jgi:hypothetical protein